MTEAGLTGRSAGHNYAPRIGAERLIAASRVLLAAFSLVALSTDPYIPATHAQETSILALAYLVYALVVAAVVWLAHEPPLVRLGYLTHLLDLTLFSVLWYLTEGPTGPFFMYFTFALVAATLRWQWPGTMWTAIASLIAFNGIGLYASEVLNDPAFDENRFIIRNVYLAVMAALVGYLGAYEERRRRQMSELAAWPRAPAGDTCVPRPELLESAARILAAPRVLLAWEESDEPWLHLASWDGGRVRSWREAPETFQPPVAEPMSDVPFLSKDVRAPSAALRCHAPPGPRRRHGSPIHPALQARFDMTAVLYLPLRGECMQGHLFVLDKPRMTWDDLLLGEVVAHEVASSMDQSLLSRRLRQAAVTEERIRLSRDLHDGVLQSLTGAALQLETVHRLLENHPGEARDRLAAIQRLVAEEQRDLRYFIRDSRMTRLGLGEGSAGLHVGLRRLTQRLETIWGLRVALQLERLDDRASDALAYDVCLIVHEALVNAARHAAASEVCVAVGSMNGHLRVVVTDNGHGFPFQGDYDHEALTTLHLGPVMLKKRVESIGGTLAIRSTPTGARLEVLLPRDPREP